MNFLHSEDGVRPWSPLHVLNRADREIGNHVLALDFSNCVLISKFVYGIDAQVCGHQVQSLGKVSVHRVRRIGEISSEKLAHDRPAFEVRRYNARRGVFGRGVRGEAKSRQRTRTASADNRSVAIAVNADNCWWLHANVYGEPQ